MHRSLVGQVIFSTTKLIPKLENAARSLSKFMDNPGKILWVELGRLICYMKGIDLKETLYLEPESCRSTGLEDLDFRNCRDMRRGIGRTLINFGGCLVD